MNRNVDQPRPTLKIFSNDVPHPSLHRGNACSKDMQKLVIQNEINVNNNNIVIRELQQQHNHPYPDAERRMTDRQANFGHSRACRRTGNNRSTCKVLGMNLSYLDFYVACCLKHAATEVNAFLFQMNRWHATYEPFL